MTISAEVSYPAADDAYPERWAVVVLAASWISAAAWWAWPYVTALQWPPGMWWWGMSAGILLGAWTLWRWRVATIATLVCDHNGWTLFSTNWRRGLALTHVVCALDGQQWMLLRVESSTGLSRWLWCVARDDPEHWPRLRRAVYGGAGHRV